MPKPLNAFLWIFCAIIAFGVLVGLLNIWNPQAVQIPFGPNGESAEGLDGLIASVLSSSVLGLVFGLLAALIAWVFNAGANKANGRN